MPRCFSPLLFIVVFASAAHGQSQDQPPQRSIDPGIATGAVKDLQAPPLPPAQTQIETPPPAAQAASIPMRIMADAIIVEGGDDLPSDQMSAAIAPFLAHRLSQNDVQDLLTAVSGMARAQGYLFARSSIPAQTMTDGKLRIALDEGRLDEVRLVGYSSDAVAAVLHPLTGHAPKRREVERQLLLAGDLPGVTIGQVRYANETGKGVLIVSVTHNRIDGSFALDNRGLEALGPERARLTVDLNGLLADNDEVTFQGLVTPLEPRELFAIYGRYAFHPTSSGTEIAIYGTYGQTHSGGLWRAYDPRGESDSIGISIAQPLVRGARTSLWLMAEGDVIGVDEWWSGALARRDRITTLGLSLNGYTPLAEGRLRFGASITQGVLALGATPRDNLLASRYDAGSDFTMTRVWADWLGTVAGPFSIRLTTTGQLVTKPLPAVEQLTIGGPYYGRGYNFSERAGDQGVLGSAELRADLFDRSSGLVRWAQLYTFGDAGKVANLETDFGTGALYSAGAGARFYLAQRLSLELEAAFPINVDRYDSDDKSPRLSLNLTNSF